MDEKAPRQNLRECLQAAREAKAEGGQGCSAPDPLRAVLAQRKLEVAAKGRHRGVI